MAPVSQRSNLPSNETELDDWLSQPTPELIQFISSVCSPLVLLGAGGKMGPTLAAVAKRAAEAAGVDLEVIAVSRFSDDRKKEWLENQGVRTLSCDLLDRRAVQKLPPAENVIYLVGLKFGTTQNPAQTWAINTLVPSLVVERYAGAKIVALSTGNVYPFSSVSEGGSIEADEMTPLGEYANAAVGRERIFEFLAQRHGTAMILLRLFYSVELRYGIVRDLADKIAAGKPVDLANGWVNCIWQSDANEMILRSLSLTDSPPIALNLTSAEILRVRSMAETLAELIGKPVEFVGTENSTALVANTSRMRKLLGVPPTPLGTILEWTAHWVKNGGSSFGKPTHFEVRNGRF